MLHIYIILSALWLNVNRNPVVVQLKVLFRASDAGIVSFILGTFMEDTFSSRLSIVWSYKTADRKQNNLAWYLYKQNSSFSVVKLYFLLLKWNWMLNYLPLFGKFAHITQLYIIKMFSPFYSSTENELVIFFVSFHFWKVNCLTLNVFPNGFICLLSKFHFGLLFIWKNCTFYRTNFNTKYIQTEFFFSLELSTQYATQR